MGNYFNKFILLDVSMEISPPQFYLGKIVHRKIVASCRQLPFSNGHWQV